MVTMKSVVRDRYGSPDILSIRDLERPVPVADELLVRVHAATVNRTDCAALTGTPFIYRFFIGFPKPRLAATGTDFAGTVEAVGPTVTRFSVGDRVFGFDDGGLGSHAEYLKVGENRALATIPDGISFERAAASLEGAHYAYNFVTKVGPIQGTRILMNGATGAIGSAAVQMLRHLGADVTAVCAAEQLETVRRLGATRVIDYTREDFTKTEPASSYDYVFDAVGKSRFSLCKPLLRPRGVYISSELGPRSENPLLALVTPLGRGRRVVFPVPVDISRSIRVVRELLVKNEFEPLLDREYPLERVAEAFNYAASGRKIGNVILKP